MKQDSGKSEKELGTETQGLSELDDKLPEKNGNLGADFVDSVAKPSPAVYVVDMKKSASCNDIRKTLVFDEELSKRESTQSYATPKSSNTTNDSVYATPPESSGSPSSEKKRQSDIDKYMTPCLAAYRKARKDSVETSPKLGQSRDNKPVVMKDYTLRGTLERKRESEASNVSDALKILFGGVGGGSNATARPKTRISVDKNLLEKDVETDNKYPDSGQFEVEKGRLKISAHAGNVNQTPRNLAKPADNFFTPMTSVKQKPEDCQTPAKKVLPNLSSPTSDAGDALMKPPLPPLSKKDGEFSADELRRQKELERERIRERARERARKKSDAELGVNSEFTPRKSNRSSSQSQSDSESSRPSSISPTKEKMSLVENVEDRWPAPRERSTSKERSTSLGLVRSPSIERPQLRWPGAGPASPTKEDSAFVTDKPSIGAEAKQPEPSEAKVTKRPMSLVMTPNTARDEQHERRTKSPLDIASPSEKLPPTGNFVRADMMRRSVKSSDEEFSLDLRASKYSSTSDDSAKDTGSDGFLRKTPRRSPAFRIKTQQNRNSFLAEFDDDSDLNAMSPEKAKTDAVHSPVTSTPDVPAKTTPHNTLERLKSQEGVSSPSDADSRVGTPSASTSDSKTFKKFKDFGKKDKKKTPKVSEDELGAVGGVERKKSNDSLEEKAAKKERRKSLLNLFKTSPKNPDSKSPKKEKKKDHGKSPNTTPKIRLKTPRSKEKKEKRKQLIRDAESDGCLVDRAKEIMLGEESLKNLTSMTSASQETLGSEVEMEGKKMNTAKKAQLAARRQQRQRQLKRLRMAQEIQRQLEEIEVKQKTMEERGVIVEQALRGEGPESTKPEKDLMQEWFNLIHEKNALVRYESELMITARELELEDRHGRLEDSLRERMSNPDEKKTPEQADEEKKILDELLEVVNQRNSLVALLEEDRLKQQKEDQDLQSVMTEKGFQLSPTSYTSKGIRAQFGYS